jgi:hypothetical protein
MMSSVVSASVAVAFATSASASAISARGVDARGFGFGRVDGVDGADARTTNRLDGDARAPRLVFRQYARRGDALTTSPVSLVLASVRSGGTKLTASTSGNAPRSRINASGTTKTDGSTHTHAMFSSSSSSSSNT